MMRTRLALALTLIGLLILIGQAFERSSRERRFFEMSLLQQRESIGKGLVAKWDEALLAAARAGRLRKTYVLSWDRSATALLTPFFPREPARLKWENYRSALNENDLEKQKNFLRMALGKEGSWDRVLAIQEWVVRHGALPDDLRLSDYERTILDPEAKEAFSRIFQLFESGRDFTMAQREVEWDGVFFSVTSAGRIEAFVPSVAEIRETILPEFLKANSISAAKLGAHPWDIRFDVIQEFEATSSWLANFISAFALVAISLGVGAYWLSLREQREALLKRVTFLNQVVHELKTPLAGLKLHVQLMKRLGPTPATLEAIDQSVGRVDRLFDDIVLINRPTQKAVLDPLSPEWLNAWAAAWTEEFPGKIEIQGMFQQEILAEKKRFAILFRNLIGNAIKYGERARVTISESRAHTEVTIEDDGPGISLLESRKIFEEFYRSEEAKRSSADGLGLGLSLVKKLSEELGANVTLANPGFPKARFVIRLPTAPPAKIAREENSNSEKKV
jgi:signal transduction histidine kinase